MCIPERATNATSTTLVAGGAGFLGSHFCDLLIAEGHEVICMDNLLNGRLENIRHLSSHPRFVFFRHDVTKPIAFPGSIENKPGWSHPTKIDYIVHFASPGSNEDYRQHRLQTLKVCAQGCYHTLGLAKQQGSAFLLASTWGISMQNPRTALNAGPRDFQDAPGHGHDDEVKRFAESIAEAYQREHGMKIRIARISDTYGERMRLSDGTLFPTLLVNSLQGKPLSIQGDGNQIQRLCYVGGLVEGLYRLLLSGEAGPVNFGGPEEVTVRELAETLIDLTGSKSHLVFESSATSGPVLCRIDISRAHEALQWNPRTRLREGIRRVVPHLRTRLANRWLHNPESGWRSPFQGVNERQVQNN